MKVSRDVFTYSLGRSSGGHREAVSTHLGKAGGGGMEAWMRGCLPGRKCGLFPATAPTGQALVSWTRASGLLR